MERICEHCGQPFESTRADAAYCSHSCRQLAYVLRKAPPATAGFGDLSYDNALQKKLTDKAVPLLSVKELSEENRQDEQTKEQEQQGTAYQPAQDKPTEQAGQIQKTSTEKKVSTEKKEFRYNSNFLSILDLRIQLRNNSYLLHVFEARYPAIAHWINTRYLCLVESLLVVSETKSIDLDDLKDISNAFNLLVQSKTYNDLPPAYPYMDEIRKYHQLIRQFCLTASKETIQIKVTRKTKRELLATRYELANMVAKVAFDNLDFGSPP